MAPVAIHPEVEAALREGRPVVALESAVVTSGLPREAVGELEVDVPRWRDDRQVNLEVALLMRRAVINGGAVPAMVAVIDGVLRIGLDESEIERLARDERAGKASISNLAIACASGATAGTTVSATLHAMFVGNRQWASGNCDKHPAQDASLRVFATGGIGGVHRRPIADSRQPAAPLDVSADLLQLARSPVLTVCSGAKSILDLPATLEALETLGVPVLGYRTKCFPQFYSAGTDHLQLSHRVETVGDAVAIAKSCWEDLGQYSGILLANPIPPQFALDSTEVEQLVEHAERDAAQRNVAGAARTPFLLAELARLSGGRTLRANIALLESNARLAGEVARRFSH